MNVQVTSVSKKEQKLARTAAAVFVISQEDIQHSGAINIPDLLRMVPGVQVAQIDANAWSISIRGFRNRYSNKVLVLIDGRSVYSNSFSGVFWEQQALPLENIERIEVIRGPGSTVWGANAMNGVINIITKSSKTTHGGQVALTSGTEGSSIALARYGDSIGKSGSYRVFSQYSRIGDSPLPLGREAADGWRRIQGGFRTDWDLTAQDSLTVEGSVFSNSEGQTRWPSFVHPLATSTFDDTITARGFDFLGRWNHTLHGGSDMSLQMYVDGYRRVDFGAPENHKAVDLDFQHHVALGDRHDMVWGVGYRATESGIGSDRLILYAPARTDSLYSAFMQDEIRITDSLRVTIGARVEHNAYTGFELEPGASLAWTPNKRNTLWASAAKAIRQPARMDADVEATLGAIPLPGGMVANIVLHGNPSFKPEELRDYEAGYRAQVSKTVSVDVTMFTSFYRRLATYEPMPILLPSNSSPFFVIPLYAGNKAHSVNYGAEFSSNWKMNSRWSLSTGYSFIRAHPTADPGNSDPFGVVALESNPKHMFQVRSRFNATKNVSIDNSLYYVAHVPIYDVPSHARFDTQISWRAGERMDVSVVGQNLLRAQTMESGDAFAIAPTLAERSIFGKVTWRF